MNDIQKYLLNCLIQNLNEKSGELISVGGQGKFNSTLDAVEVALSLTELKAHVKAAVNNFKSQVETDVKYLEQ